MNRTLRIAPITEWMLGPGITSRHSRLLDVPPPDQLLAKVIEEASRSAKIGRIRLCWQEADECQGYFRLVARMPLEQEATFDQFFNGRSGYRAQYYLSPEEGVLYNRDVLQGLKDALIGLDVLYCMHLQSRLGKLLQAAGVIPTRCSFHSCHH